MFRSGSNLPEWFITALNIPTVPGYQLESLEVQTTDTSPMQLKASAVYENSAGDQCTRKFEANSRQIDKFARLLHIPKGCTGIKLSIASGNLVETTVKSYLSVPDTTSVNRSLSWALGDEVGT